MSQTMLADAMGVPKSKVHRWETGDLLVARERVRRLSEVLQTGEERLLEVLDSSLRRRPSLLLPAELAPLTPIECSMAQMWETVQGSRQVSTQVMEKVGLVPCQELELMFLRQTPWELYAGHVVLLDPADLAWASPLVEGCRKPIFGKNGLYEGHLLRLAIIWERASGVRDVLFPQVPIRIVGQKGEESYRVDYLIVHSAPRRPPQTIGLEFDGDPHRYQKAKDAERTSKLPFPVIRFDNAILRSPHFLPRLFEQIQEKARWAQAHGEAYDDFLDDRQERFERLKAAS